MNFYIYGLVGDMTDVASPYVPYTTSGSGSSLVMSVLDCKLLDQNKTAAPVQPDKTGMIDLCKDRA